MCRMKNGGRKILVVDDVAETLDGIEILLERDGYRITTARTVRDAIFKAGINVPDLLLISLEGKVADVINVAKRIRQRTSLKNDLPVIIFCVGELPEGGETTVGQNIYLACPDNFDQLRDFISHLFVEFPEIILT